MRKIIIFSLAISLGIFTACNNGNAVAKVNPSKLEDAKKRDQDISIGAIPIRKYTLLRPYLLLV